MTYHTFTDMPPIQPADVVDAMGEKVLAAIERYGKPTANIEAPTLLRLTVPIDTNLAPLSWLAAQETTPRLFWSDRDGYWEMAGVGVADSIKGSDSTNLRPLFARLQAQFANAPEAVRYYGGFRFDQQIKDDDGTWDDFPALWFVLPRFEFVRYGDARLLVCNITQQDLRQSAGSEILEPLKRISLIGNPEDFSPIPSPRREDQPNEAHWQDCIDTAHALFGSGELKKIVLARRSELTFTKNISALQLMDQLQNVSERCYMFLFQPDNKSSFIGSTPERLYSRDGLRIATEAVAGTRSRGTDPDDDERLAEGLMSSVKERLEHQLVVDGITQALRELNASIKVDRNVSVVKLPHVQHLCTRIYAKLNEPLIDIPFDQALLESIHPTPAVAGLPTDTAMDKIRRLEPFDRGWYAGPVGWIGPNSAEFAVAIRSGLVKHDKLHLYAGAGIVPGSVAEHEWRELNKKLTRFIELFTNGQ